jgi:iron-sulfur cluster assembly protein
VLTLTPEAVRAVVDVVVSQEPGSTAGLRIAPGPASAADRTWDYAVARQPFDGDLVIEAGPARVFVDPDAAQPLENAVLDAHVDDDTLDTRFHPHRLKSRRNTPDARVRLFRVERGVGIDSHRLTSTNRRARRLCSTGRLTGPTTRD